jgi:hypothetical protein
MAVFRKMIKGISIILFLLSGLRGKKDLTQRKLRIAEVRKGIGERWSKELCWRTKNAIPVSRDGES